MSSKGTDPEDVDATFAAIVADLRAEGVFAEATAEAAEAAEPPPAPEKPAKPAEPDSPSWRAGGSEWDEVVLGEDPAEDTEHFVPPEPPPLPRPGKGAFIVLLFFLVGLFLLIAPNLIGLSATVGTPLGILSLATAIALLLLRVKQTPHDGDGAQV
ncbi:hypothetical protein HFP15_09150 [Amycolatopsis sp. K13G38]|uniref:DUF308 domain-containing protein n=1 Tax=Amycolatopsis acididurans TaxID=2724524 RepID=A0ABX1J419_9PSEU|nr:hypothetical protein [Amycolatopsis acididurans]NKQ53047.1 hypothetical protein [Amycolatopsis acididurans]